MKAVKLPSGSWRVQVQVNGSRKSITRKTKKEAEAAAADFVLRNSSAPAAPLGVLVDQYIASRENIASPQTIVGYEKIRRNNLTDLYEIPVQDLTNERIQRSINALALNHSPKTVRNAYGLISATLAVYAPEKRLNVSMPSERPPEYNLPSSEELWALIEAAGDNLRTAIMLAAFCSLRREEIAALRSEDIEGNVIHVRRAIVHDKNGADVEKATKTYGSDRYVPAPDFVIEQISGREGRVCPIALATITGSFVKLRNKLGLKCRFHDLRHYYASALHAADVRDQYIQLFGGWKSSATLHKIYRNTLPDYEEEFSQKAVKFFEDSHEVHTKGQNV